MKRMMLVHAPKSFALQIFNNSSKWMVYLGIIICEEGIKNISIQRIQRYVFIFNFLKRILFVVYHQNKKLYASDQRIDEH